MARYLQIVDFGSYTHALLNTYPFAQEDHIPYLEYNLGCMLSGCLVKQMMLPSSTIQTIVIEDAKPYWRHGLLWENFKVNYKGNRTKQPQRQEFVEGIRGKCLDILKTWGVNTLRMQATTPVANRIYGYEADDGCAGVIKLLSGMYDGVFTLTIDSDYLPFTADPKVIWCCTGHHAPRVRQAKEGLFWCKTSPSTTNTKLKKAFPWECVSQLWKFKAYFGDASDNIRGNRLDKSPGRYEPYVDLYNPHPDFICWQEDYFKDLVDYVLTEPIQAVTFFDYNSDYYIGQTVAIHPLSFESTNRMSA